MKLLAVQKRRGRAGTQLQQHGSQHSIPSLHSYGDVIAGLHDAGAADARPRALIWIEGSSTAERLLSIHPTFSIFPFLSIHFPCVFVDRLVAKSGKKDFYCCHRCMFHFPRAFSPLKVSCIRVSERDLAGNTSLELAMKEAGVSISAAGSPSIDRGF